MRVLVTGGAGFIGSHFIRHLLNRYPAYQVINLDKLTYAGNLENLRDVENSHRYRFVQGDICSPSTVEPLVAEADAVLNFAAETHVDRSIMEAGAFIQTDVFGTYTLLEAARKTRLARFIQVSTDEVYGSLEEGAADENYLLRPSSPYAASKAGGDQMVQAFICTHRLPAIITRCTNNYGSNQYPEKFIPLFITNLLEGEKVPLYGDGRNVRDWIHVRDHCLALDVILHRGEEGQIYNIGGDNPRTNLEVTHALLQVMGRDEGVIQWVADRPGHDRRYAVDSSRIRSLGWKPEIRFQEGLRDTVQWYETHPEWWKPIKSGEFRKYYRAQYRERSGGLNSGGSPA